MLTGNPHAFDNGTAAGNFLYQMIQMDLEIRKIKIEFSEIFPAYKRQKSYLMAGIVLDLFAKSGIRVYYAGDLDPEGILIAQKLSQYYKGEFHYWHM